LHKSPVSLLIVAGRIAQLVPGRQSFEADRHIDCGFVLPGLVEAHCHLFLDGAELDLERRSAYLNLGMADFVATGRRNLAALRAAGVTLVRDAGDRHGVNHALRAEVVGTSLPQVRSAGRALRRKGRYGSFMADEIDSIADAQVAVERRRGDVDDLKVVLTGIIDFAAATVKGAPQFDRVMLDALMSAARSAGLRTFAHCLGADGIDLAIAAGLDSIEHGFFMAEHHLPDLAARGIAWVPTWSPVGFQAEQPGILGLDDASRRGIASILDNHRRMMGRAAQVGVRLIAGSDAGSLGVVHGRALIDELTHFHAAGLTIEQTLATATSAPRLA